MTLAYVLVFLVTNVPYVIHELCIAYAGPDSLGRKISAVIGNTGNRECFRVNKKTISGVLPPLNSAINPIIYLLFNSRIYWIQVYIILSNLKLKLRFLNLTGFNN